MNAPLLSLDSVSDCVPTLQAHELSDSIFNHMFRYESAAEARRRALMLVDVLVVAILEDFCGLAG